jgi:hypothetical protein
LSSQYSLFGEWTDDLAAEHWRVARNVERSEKRREKEKKKYEKYVQE